MSWLQPVCQSMLPFMRPYSTQSCLSNPVQTYSTLPDLIRPFPTLSNSVQPYPNLSTLSNPSQPYLTLSDLSNTIQKNWFPSSAWAVPAPTPLLTLYPKCSSFSSLCSFNLCVCSELTKTSEYPWRLLYFISNYKFLFVLCFPTHIVFLSFIVCLLTCVTVISFGLLPSP